MFPTEGARLLRLRVLVRRRPVRPHPSAGIQAVQMFIQRAIGGKFFQQIAFAIPEGRELRDTWRAQRLRPFVQKLREHQLEETQLEGANTFVFDERSVAQSGDFGRHCGRIPQSHRAAAAREILHALHVEVNKILIKRAVGQIRAGIERPPVVDGVQRIKRHETALQLLRGEIHHLRQVAEVSASPIARRAHAIETDGDSGRASSPAQVRRDPGTLGCHDISNFRRRAGRFHGNLVVAERQFDRQAHQLAHTRAAVHFQVRRLRQVPQVHLKSVQLPILAGNDKTGALTQRFYRKIQRQLLRGGFQAHHRRRRQPFPLAAGESGKRLLQLFGIAGRDAQRPQNSLLGGCGGVVIPAPNVPVPWLDARLGRGAVEELLECVGHAWTRTLILQDCGVRILAAEGRHAKIDTWIYLSLVGLPSYLRASTIIAIRKPPRLPPRGLCSPRSTWR